MIGTHKAFSLLRIRVLLDLLMILCQTILVSGSFSLADGNVNNTFSNFVLFTFLIQGLLLVPLHDRRAREHPGICGVPLNRDA